MLSYYQIIVKLDHREGKMQKNNFEVVNHLSIRYFIMGGKGGHLKVAHLTPQRVTLGSGVYSPLHLASILKERI